MSNLIGEFVENLEEENKQIYLSSPGKVKKLMYMYNVCKQSVITVLF